MVAGIAFVVLFIGFAVTIANSLDVKDTDSAAISAQKFITKLSDSGNRVGLLVGAYLVILAAIAFVWFVTGLRHWLAGGLAAGS